MQSPSAVCFTLLAAVSLGISFFVQNEVENKILTYPFIAK
jgi:hypothetical protein